MSHTQNSGSKGMPDVPSKWRKQKFVWRLNDYLGRLSATKVQEN